MKKPRYRLGTAVGIVAAAALCFGLEASAARVAILSNAYYNETTFDFASKISGHTFTGIDVTSAVPSLETLTASFDVILLFEDRPFVNSTAVGNRVAAFAQTGRPVVLGTFYDQGRSDASPSLSPQGWGALEAIDPNTTDGNVTPYLDRWLDVSTMVDHALTVDIESLTARSFAGGNQAKPGTIVVAKWQQKNARGVDDPAIAYRITGPACVIHIGIAPDYPIVGVAGTDFTGDFYTVWKNAFDFGAAGCPTAAASEAFAIPTLSRAALALTVLLLAGIGFAARRR